MFDLGTCLLFRRSTGAKERRNSPRPAKTAESAWTSDGAELLLKRGGEGVEIEVFSVVLFVDEPSPAQRKP